MKERIVPPSQHMDALHVATATVNGMGAVVSWNLRHLVKLRTRRLVAAMNIREGYAPVDIITPEEVIA